MKTIATISVALVAAIFWFLIFRCQRWEYVPMEGFVTAKYGVISNFERSPQEWRIHVKSRYVSVSQIEFDLVEVGDYYKER